MATKRKSSEPETSNSKRFHSFEDDDDGDEHNQSQDVAMVMAADLSGIYDNSLETCGTIKKIHVKSFMCHDSLEVDFNKNINFLIGRNGSGKSAILTALVVGLAGRATLTNRGSTIKNFIKKGERACQVEITLNNNGLMAYKSDEYGAQIQIIRKILASGASSYQLKSETGQLVSRSGREVHSICTSFNIQVNNPICILNQDTARNFLSGSDPKKMYAMFFKATNMETIDHMYNRMVATTEQLKKTLDAKTVELNELQQQVDVWKTKYDSFDVVRQVEQGLKRLDDEQFWLDYSKVKEARDEIVAGLNDLMKKCEEFKRNNANQAGDLDEITREIQEFERQIQEVDGNKCELASNLRVIQEQCHKFEREMGSVTFDHEKFRRELERKVKHCENLETQLKSINKGGDLDDQREQFRNELANAAKKQKEVTSQLELATLELQQRENTLQRNNYEIEQLVEKIRNDDGQIQQRAAQIRSLATAKNKLALFGDQILRVCNEIQTKKHEFHELPRGPIGVFIKIRDRKWVQPIENFMKSEFLRTFVVANSHDSKVLMQIFNRIFANEHKPQVICTKFFYKTFDTSKTRVRVPNGYASMLDMLDVSDPVVENVLIDQFKVEKIILLPTDTDGQRLLSSEENVPPNCYMGVTINGDLYFPFPDFRSYGVNSRPATYLQSSNDEAIKEMERDIMQMKFQRDRTEKERMNAVSGMKEQRAFLEEHRAHVAKLKEKKKTWDNAFMRLDMEKDDMVDPNDAIMPLRQDIEQTKNEILQLERQIDETQLKITALREEIDAKTHEIDRLKRNISELDERIHALTHEKNVKNQLLESRVEIERSLQTKLKSLEAKKYQLQEKLTESNQKLDEYNSNRAEHGSEIIVPRPRKDIDIERTRLQTQLRKTKKCTESREYVLEMYKTCAEKHAESDDLIRICSENYRSFKDGADKRIRNQADLVERVSKYVNQMFKTVLRLRGFKGAIKFDHAREQLELFVQTQTNVRSTGNTKTLSGGERSYTTIAFIMALWRCVDFPFYFLDEFDVFMDKVNRRTVMDLLIQHAELHPERQFAFLTPQDLSVQSAANLSIFRMPDPKKN